MGRSFRYSPISCNRRKVRFRWLRALLALRCCVRTICRLIHSADFREQRPPRTQVGIRYRVAVRTWQTARSGFFPPMGLVELGQKQIADATENQVTPDGQVFTHLEVVHPQFALAILSIFQRLKATNSSVSTDVDSGALLMKYLIFFGSRTL